MRVIHVVASLDDRAGGLTGAVVSIANAGARQGLDVTVAATTDGRGDARAASLELDPRVQIRLFDRSRLTGRFSGSSGLRRWLRTIVDADTVVHAHAIWDLASWSALRAARRSGAALLVSPHGSLDPFDLRKHRLAKRLIGPWALRRGLDGATILCTTREEARRMVTYGAAHTVEVLALPPGRIDRPALGRAEFRERHGVAADAPLVLFLGRIDYKKGIAHLLEATAQLPTGAVLMIVGAGEPDYERAMRSLAEDLRVTDRVRWTGWLRGTDKAAAYAAADVFVLLSDTENYGIAVVEALQHGLVAVTSDQVGVGVDLADDHAVLLSSREPAAAAQVLDAALTDSALRGRTLSAAHEVLTGRLEPRRVDGDYGSLLRRVAGAGARAARVDPRRRGLLRRILLGTAIACALGGSWLLVPTTYTAAATVYMQTSSDDAAALVPQATFQQNQLQSYSALAHGNVVTRDAVADARVGVSPAALSRALSVQVIPQTVILRVGVTDRDPEVARVLADAVARQVVTQANSFQQEGSGGTDPARLVLLDTAGEPATSTSRLRGLVLSVLAGVLVALAVPRRRTRRLLRTGA